MFDRNAFSTESIDIYFAYTLLVRLDSSEWNFLKWCVACPADVIPLHVNYAIIFTQTNIFIRHVMLRLLVVSLFVLYCSNNQVDGFD